MLQLHLEEYYQRSIQNFLQKRKVENLSQVQMHPLQSHIKNLLQQNHLFTKRFESNLLFLWDVYKNSLCFYSWYKFLKFHLQIAIGGKVAPPTPPNVASPMSPNGPSSNSPATPNNMVSNKVSNTPTGNYYLCLKIYLESTCISDPLKLKKDFSINWWRLN